MSVRLGLLAILDQGACYGYQLRAEFDRRTAAVRPLNVGQIYNTLERLRRDGLVVEGHTDEQGHVFWRITDAGRAAAREWLNEPVDRGASARDDLAVKVSLAVTLPGMDVERMLRAQHAASSAQLLALRERRTDAPDLTTAIVQEAALLAAEAELRWLDRVAALIAEGPGGAVSLAPASRHPKRGRPARPVSAVA